MQSVDYSLPSIIVYEVKPHGLMDQTGRYFVIMNGRLSKAVPEFTLPGIQVEADLQTREFQGQ